MFLVIRGRLGDGCEFMLLGKRQRACSVVFVFQNKKPKSHKLVRDQVSERFIKS